MTGRPADRPMAGEHGFEGWPSTSGVTPAASSEPVSAGPSCKSYPECGCHSRCWDGPGPTIGAECLIAGECRGGCIGPCALPARKEVGQGDGDSPTDVALDPPSGRSSSTVADAVPHLGRACELLWQHGHPAVAEALERDVRAALASAHGEDGT